MILPTPTVYAQTQAPAQVIVLGQVANVQVTSDDVLSQLQAISKTERQAILSKPDSVQQLTNNLLVRRVLASEALRDGLAQDPITAAAVAVATDRILSDARLIRIDKQNEPSEAALDAYARNMYQANNAKFEVPATTRARHILLPNTGADSLAKARELLAQLRAGASFEDLAKIHSTDAGSAARGGDLGFFGAGKMVRPFEDAVNALAKPGDLSEPVESQFGYHIIRLEERREKGVRPYEEVKSQLIAEARQGLLNESRVLKAQSINKEIVFQREAIEAMAKPTQQ